MIFELLQMALGERDRLSDDLNDAQWMELYADVKKQSVLGVAFEGIQRLPKEQWPPQRLLFEWIATSEQIKSQNALLNKRSVEITELFEKGGYRSCILKGQGNAVMYPNPYSRTPGDIDIWVEGDRDDIRIFVASRAKGAVDGDMHITFPIFEDAVVEVHYKPRYMNTPKYDKALMGYLEEHRKKQFNNKTALPGDVGQISVPTAEFNVVYQMSHLMGHFFVEGIGLRQFVDYYYVLKSYRREEHGVNVIEVFQQTGMLKFAKGVMWIEKECLGIGDDCLVVAPDEKVGKIILREIIEGGNFGHYDERYKSRRRGLLARGLTDTYRLLKLTTIFPSESLWKIIKKIDNQKWKIIKS